ncbi:hypothetical protein [Flavobacterium chungangense]|uniref:hypothetical protein n=1 Tax=Flavobacterium chungangense TaxID=554283 RepID=UPI0004DF6061|nr:hypothetical protein [Flavobacterium chungangense]
MKIISIILLLFLFFSCKKYIIPNENSLNFVPNKSIEIKSLLPFKKKSVCIGSYTTGKDYVISQFEIESKYSLIVIKLKNISNNFEFNNHLSFNYSTSGYFDIVNEGLYEAKLSPGVFENNYKINKIDFFSDSQIENHITTDSIKSFSLNFNKYAIKFNNDDTKLIFSEIEYYGLKSLHANVLFYKSENEGYIFIMTPLKKNISLDKNILYDYLFG